MRLPETTDSPATREQRCQICAQETLEIISGYELFQRVTSDCQPWPADGRLAVCRTCGGVQKVIDHQWQAETDAIYRAYHIYHQSGGVEQPVFDAHSGQALARSTRLLAYVQQHAPLQPTGRLLDFGCGNGAFLRTFHALAPNWSLVGMELNEAHRSSVETIPGVEAFCTCAPEDIPGTFNIITMIHALEHCAYPGNVLAQLWNKLAVGGILIVEVPNYTQNPFDLLIADHSLHFTPATLTTLLHNASYETFAMTSDWIPKEITAIARKRNQPQQPNPPSADPLALTAVVQHLAWLRTVVNKARQWAAMKNFGLFGTSIAATWLFSELEDLVHFFVDEDPHRIGKLYHDRPIYQPSDVPDESHVYLALPPKIAAAIQRRLAKSGEIFLLPPTFDISSKNAAIFLDRDGVLIEDKHLLTSTQDICLLPGVPQALNILKNEGFALILISNQPVVARGMATEQEVQQVNRALEDLLIQAGGPRFDGMYICPHHPNATVLAYRMACECRKPRPGLLIRAALEQNLNLSTSIMIGDRITDILAGVRAGCRTISVHSGKHLEPPIETVEPIDQSVSPDYVCADLQAAAVWILNGT
jgi:D,D-heptose 1,7-bisphosphate phosphatase